MKKNLLPLYAALLAAWSAEAAPSAVTQQQHSGNGLAKSDWSSIQAAYQAGRHAFHPVEGGWAASNPGQQWI